MSSPEQCDLPAFADYMVVRAVAEFAVLNADGGFAPEELRAHLLQTCVLPETSTPTGFEAYFTNELQPAVLTFMQSQRGERRRLPEYAWAKVADGEQAARFLLLGGSARRPARVLSEYEFWECGPRTKFELEPLAIIPPIEQAAPSPQHAKRSSQASRASEPARLPDAAPPPGSALPPVGPLPRPNPPPARPRHRISSEILAYVPRPARTPLIKSDESLIKKLIDNLLEQTAQQKAPVPWDGLLSAADRESLGGDKLKPQKIDDVLNELALRALVTIIATGRGKKMALLVRPSHSLAFVWRQQPGRILASLWQPRRRR